MEADTVAEGETQYPGPALQIFIEEGCNKYNLQTDNKENADYVFNMLT